MVQYIFLTDILFLGVIFDLNEYFFPWQMCFFFGGGKGHLRLVILHLGKYDILVSSMYFFVWYQCFNVPYPSVSLCLLVVQSLYS